jgi:putative Mg2+ transporter-C (MgtC) family protein
MTPLEFAVNVAVALGLGLAIGLERQWHQHPAGMRTNALVAFGAALYVSLSYLGQQNVDPTRIAAQIVSGLGFLGGGVILKEGASVRGLSTAATIWCSGAVGTLAGAGFLIQALIGAAAILALHFTLRPIVFWMDALAKRSPNVESDYRLRVTCTCSDPGAIRALLLRHVGSEAGMTLHGLATEDGEGSTKVIVADVHGLKRSEAFMEEIIRRVGIEPDVKAASWQRVMG